VESLGARREGLVPDCDACWICEGWQEVKFLWVPGSSGSLAGEPMFLHLDFEGFR
jgi:hypothetical protein